MNRRNKNISITLGVFFLFILVAIIIWFLSRPSDDTPVFDAEIVLADHAISYNDDGIIQLFDVETGEKLDNFDLKSLSEEREVVIEETPIDVEMNEPVEVEQKKEESYKDFDIVWMTIEKGDNAWTIQSVLTPERNPSTMLGYVREINEFYAMHPIYPGQKYGFLKEKGTDTDAQYAEKLTEAPEEFIKAEAENQLIEDEKEIVKKVEREETYIFYASQKDDKLYAHSDFNNTLYEISVDTDKKKLSVSEKWKKHTSKVGSPTSFIFENDVAYFEYAASKNLIVLELGKHLHSINLEDVPSHRVVVDGVYVYTFGDYVAHYKYATNETKKAMLGDITKDLIELSGEVYAINAFGQESMKNLLMKINPEDLYIHRLQEINSDEVTFASYGDSEDLWVSFIEKKYDLDGELIETELMNGVDTKRMKFSSELWEFDLLTLSYSAKNYIYDLSVPEEVSIYQVKSNSPTHSFEFEGDNLFIILPD